MLAFTVVVLFGLSFSLTLLLYTWRSSVDQLRTAFTYKAASIGDAITRGTAGTDDAARGLAALIGETPELSSADFQRYAQSLLRHHSYVEAVSWHVLGEDHRHWPVRQQVSRFGVAAEDDLASTPGADEAINAVLSSGDPMPGGALTAGTLSNRYLLFAPVPATARVSADTYVPQLVVFVVNPHNMIGPLAHASDMRILITGEAQGLVGRQVLYDNQPAAGDADSGWHLGLLEKTALVTFPTYAIRLHVEKEIKWQDVELGPLVAASVLGAGITLLLFALARSRELQTRELRDRNREIERQVREQTLELARARDQALEASRVKSDFLASMSHEIRTPLNAIIGMGELLGGSSLSTEQNRYVQVFRKAGEALLDLVSDILDLAKIEAHQLTLEQIDFDVFKLLQDAVDIHALKAAERNIDLVLQVAPGLPRHRRGDPTRLRQVILNLTGNALKFTERGKVVVAAVPSGEQPAGVRFSVTDTGIGIPSDKHQTIFESFSQVDSSTTRKYGGTGLGLAICKTLVEMMGGTIGVESEPGRGSCFFFELPLPIADTAGRPDIASNVAPAATPEIPRARLLVVDDNVDNRLLIRAYLKTAPCDIDEADNGAVAVDKFKQSRYDLVLMDMQMPVLDGYSATRAIREWEHAQGRLPAPIIALTAYAVREDVDKSLAAGCTAHLTKPLRKQMLLENLRQFLTSADGR
ncbi:MAG TPA: ATP-binding protein [Gammaproteobacteria bacterium]|nr:ATP-binding protein [Gammaproteobacteria bacterium]